MVENTDNIRFKNIVDTFILRSEIGMQMLYQFNNTSPNINDNFAYHTLQHYVDKNYDTTVISEKFSSMIDTQSLEVFLKNRNIGIL